MYRHVSTIALAVALGVFGLSAQAQDGASVTGGAAPLQAQPSPSASLAYPSVFGATSAVSAPNGTAFAALSYVTPRGGVKSSDDDGDLSLGYAFGNPVSGVSAQVAINVLGLDPFGDAGSVSLSLSRMLRAGGSSATFASVGAGNVLPWGVARRGDTTYVAAVSHIQAYQLANGVELPVQYTFGYGSASTLSDDGRGRAGPGAFFGVGMGLTWNMSGSISFTETQVNMGLNLSIPQLAGVGLSLGVYDVTDNTNRQQVALGLSLAF